MEELAVTSDQIYIFNLSDVNFDIQNPYVYLIDPPLPNTSHQHIKSQFPGLHLAYHFKSFNKGMCSR